MTEPKTYTYLTETRIDPDAIAKGLEVVGREIEKIKGPAGDDVRWYMDVLRAGLTQKDKQIGALAESLVMSASEQREDGPCWCGPGVADAIGHSPYICLPKREALRLIGRLP